MQASGWTWLTRKAWIALPVILVLALARCGGDTGETTSLKNQTNARISDEPETLAPSKSTDKAPGNKRFSSSEIKAAMREHIRKRTELGNPGVFEITDPRTSQNLQLRFQMIHDPVRVIDGQFYFACTNFAEINDPDKTYDLDFWLQELNGELVVYEENVHKLPARSDNQWVQQPRYNFVNDRINLLR
ncbi:hypothetical protein GCM10011533_02870 [Streptosporangium jomthongense]|uniref:Uncharacterized protein n=1 Tax=Marinobacter aromaticivorans TaxID=1494078 RepID=A0ABW2IRF0_9GAMM|nr:hypothetical protein [Marinobacter aromaticivorans]GGE53807.1 hypothetical protein GCM10011533_02870 [Streptosporangium jomthongense]